MTVHIIPPNPTRPIIENNSTMSQEFRAWTQEITRQSVIISAGSPEGIIEAEIGQEYMDNTGTTGNIKYIKRDLDIAGDKTKGWILI